MTFMEIHSYRTMWILVMFDLPVKTPVARQSYAEFRRMLKRDGFSMLQYSVYGRHCPSDENAQVHMAQVEAHLPLEGRVRILSVTEKQFERMRCFWGKMRKPPEEPTQQLSFF
jgi:CRISPR-associated protein Cas2